jgi:uncharacterized phiE125 gp8 family phage protein
MSDLTKVEKVKAYLGLTAGGDDAILNALIANESQYIKSWLNRDLVSQVYSETYDGTGGAVLVLPNYPITAVASVAIDGLTIAACADATASGYVFNESKISLRGYRFSKGMQNVAVTYTAGYTVIPDDLQQACIELVALSFKERDRIGLSSKGIQGEQTNFIVKDMPDSVRGILNQYKRVFPHA